MSLHVLLHKRFAIKVLVEVDLGIFGCQGVVCADSVDLTILLLSNIEVVCSMMSRILSDVGVLDREIGNPGGWES